MRTDATFFIEALKWLLASDKVEIYNGTWLCRGAEHARDEKG
jgi:hypothetical protein